jgi:hypothetical protein
MLPVILSLSFLLASQTPAPADIVWVFFKDKGNTAAAGYDGSALHLTAKARQRRVLNMGSAFDYDDLPVFQNYVDEIICRGGELRYKSNWLNAASFRIRPDLVKKIESLPYVKKIRPVAVYKQTSRVIPHSQSRLQQQKNDNNHWKDFYGSSYPQAAMLNVPRSYFSGYTGSGVLVGMLDTGFKRGHNALKDVRIAEEQDFVTGDDFFFDGKAVLANVVLAQDPLLFVDGNNSVHLFYSADTFSSGSYTRPLFWATAPNWQPVALSSILGDNAACRPTATGTDTVFLAWQGFGFFWDRRINFGYYDGSWKGIQFVTAGAVPALTQFGEKLFLFYIANDSLLALRIGTISGTGVAWSQENIFSSGAERIGSTQAVAAPLGNIYIFWSELSSGRIFFSHSTDSGVSFSTPGVLDSVAGSVKAAVTNTTVHLVYKDNSKPPYVFLAYKNSADWNKKVSLAGDSILYPGDFSITGDGNHITVGFESNGQIYTVESTNNGQSWTTPAVVPGSPDEFAYAPRVAAGHRLWLRRGDDNTDYDPAEDNIEQPNHGTRMLSVIGGYQFGQLVGIAPGADFIIAKTEKFKGLGSSEVYEFLVEEDTWIEGLEWLEKSGADLVTSSLGYIEWYTYKDMDGKTAPVSIAASLAAKRGLLIVNAIGNRGTPPASGPYINAPGDADGIITMGGTLIDTLYRAGTPLTDTFWWNGSGFGPTADGRMKPELLAPANDVYAVNPDTADLYSGGAGTSFATALMAGGCALVKEAHPSWSLDSLKAVLFITASNYAHPTDTLGYGLANIDSAIHWTPPQPPPFSANSLGDPFPNPFIPERQTTIRIPFLILQSSWVKLRIFTLTGELVKSIDLSLERNKILFMPGRYERRDPNDPFAAATWDGKNDAGKPVASGVYLVLLTTGYGSNVKKIAVVR